MKKYPIDAAVFLKAMEKENGRPVDLANRKLWELIVELQNQAYDAGRRDGFMERFKGADEVAPSHPDPNPADEESADALRALREKMETAFDETGFDSVIGVLGTPPDSMSLGQRIYAMVSEAFFQGALYSILYDIKEMET